MLKAEADVDKPGLGLNIGSGTWQLESRQLQQGYRASMLSLDKRLGLPIQVDLQDVLNEDVQMIEGVYLSPEELSVYGRVYADPLTMAGDASSLALATNSMNWVGGLFSVPLYLNDTASVRATLLEANRVLKPGGFGRFYPVREDRVATVEQWFKENGLDHELKHTGNYGLNSMAKGYLLTWQKPS